MKANELMIGDWVMVYPWDETPWKPNKITDINFHSWEGTDFCDSVGVEEWDELSLDDIKPIPLTAEILKKNGFYASEVSSHHIKYVCSTGPIDEFADIVLICGKDNKDKWRWDCLELRIHYYRGDIHQFKINYVHELQHALRLCGIEKEIEL